MPLRRVEATVLRVYRVGEADKLVVFFTRELGKVRGIARGARRPRSRFGGGLEVGTAIELSFFEKEGQELVRVDRCDIIRSDFARWRDPVLACALGYFAELVDAFVPEREPNVKLYRLLRAATEALAEGVDPRRTARYFEAWLLRLAGHYPRGRRCEGCGARLDRSGARYSLEEQRLGCTECQRRGVLLGGATMRFVDRMWREPPTRLPAPESTTVLDELGGLHAGLIRAELDREPASRRVLEDMLEVESRTP